MEAKKFTESEVLQVTTGRLLGDIGDVYKLTPHLVGRDVYTHQIPALADQCRNALLRQFPELANADEHLVDLDRRLETKDSGQDRAVCCRQWVHDLLIKGIAKPQYNVWPIDEAMQVERDPLWGLLQDKKIVVVGIENEN